MHQEMADGNKTIDSLAMMGPTSASSSTHPPQVSPEPYCKNDEDAPTVGCQQPPYPLDQNMDPQKLRRIISNRASAYRCRWRQNWHISHMERRAKALETQVSMLLPQIGAYQNQHKMLLMERDSLERQISYYMSNQYHKEAEIEEKRSRVKQLRLILGKQREITQKEALYRGKMVPSGGTNNPAQIGKNTAGETSQLSKINVQQGTKEGHTWMPTPFVPKTELTATLGMGSGPKPQPKKNSKPKDPLSLSLSING